MRSMVLILISCILTAIGQVAFKYGMNIVSPKMETAENLLYTLYVVLFNPVIILGFFSFGAGAVVWLFALAKLELSYAVPLSALTYVLVLAAGVFLFREPFTLIKVLGTILVAVGIAVLSLGEVSR